MFKTIMQLVALHTLIESTKIKLFFIGNMHIEVYDEFAIKLK